MKSKVFVTGITGCVGHYIFDLLVSNPDYELYFLVRNPKKMMRDFSSYPNVKIIQDEMKNIEKHAELLAQMDYVIHVAAGWGGRETNYRDTIALFRLLNPAQCKRVIYFSTASILDSNNNPMEQADKFGTSYIQSKYRCYQHLAQLKIYDRIVTLFPTWVLGGDERHPYSHAMSGIIKVPKRLWLLRFFTFDLKFHFIHAQDIALIVDYLLKNEVSCKKYVLGNPLISASQLIKEICDYYHKKIYFRIKISPSFVKLVTLVFGKKLLDWDKFCLTQSSFEHKVAAAKTFGISSEHENVADVLG